MYASLHRHSDRSILDGIDRLPVGALRVAEMGQTALAVTDHGTLGGAVQHVEACAAVGIKPVLGCELYVARASRNTRDATERKPYHLTALAATNQGWENLVKLTTLAATEGVYYKPRVDRELLERYNEGIIILSGCLGGELAQGRDLDTARWYADTFSGRYYIEVMSHDITEEDEYRQWASVAARKLGLPVVATPDSHYTMFDDADDHDTVLAMQTLDWKDNPKRAFKFTGNGFHLPDEDEMLARFPQEWLDESQRIADACNVTLPVGRAPMLPSFKVPAPWTDTEYLTGLCDRALHRKYGEDGVAHNRMTYELDVIISKGFASYFLIVADIVDHARSIGVNVGPGRGSVGGSIVAYLLGITTIDPLKWETMFERFLNPDRNKMPDIDLDFDDVGRAPVLQYIEAKYGSDNVAQVCTVNRLGAASSLNAVASALRIPHESYVVQETALRLEGIAKSIGRHAAGVVISPTSLFGAVPMTATKTDVGAVSRQTVWEMDDLATMGYLKVDILGVSRLGVIGDTVKMANARGAHINIDRIPLNDSRVFAELSRGNVHGVFQFDSYGGKKLCMAIRPQSIEDLAIITSLDRPGPLQAGQDGVYADRLYGRTPVEYIIPALQPILEPTYGVIIFQEQVMQIARDIAGYTLGESDLIREAVGHKLPELMAAQRTKFVAGARTKMDDKTAAKLWDYIALFAGYGFNRPHAIAYALVACQCAWLRTHYPVEFFCALLNDRLDNTDMLQQTQRAARNAGVKLLRPDIYDSTDRYTIDGEAIRTGLVGIKDFGGVAYRALLDARAKATTFGSLRHLLSTAHQGKLNSKAMTALIRAGALHELGEPGTLLRELPATIESIRTERADRQKTRYLAQGLTSAGNARKRPMKPDVQAAYSRMVDTSGDV
jgi:DNA polymerase III subunit alpha